MEFTHHPSTLHFFEQPFVKLKGLLEEANISAPATHYLYRKIFQHGVEILNTDNLISLHTKQVLAERFNFSLPSISKIHSAADGTHKFLLRLADGEEVEAVLIPFHKRYTICLSCQVGCKMGCSFCFTATAGFTRNLEAYEIVGQYLVLTWWAKTHLDQKGRIKPNLVFMGQGEPLDNFDNLKLAIDILLQSTGIHLGPRQMTLSTCGLIPGLARLHELAPINLAISLHSPCNEVRDQLIPINKRYPLPALFQALSIIPLSHRQYITFEYLLIAGLTDRATDAQELATLIKPFKALVNLIPFNPFPGSNYLRPTKESIEEFKSMLVEKKVRVMIRTTKGDDILAACGQLKAQK